MITGEGDLGDGRQFTGGDPEYVKDEGGVEEDDEDPHGWLNPKRAGSWGFT